MKIHWLASGSLVVLVGLLLFGAGCTSHSGEPKAEVVVQEPFTPEVARRALADVFIPVYGEGFAQELRDAPIEFDSKNKDEFYVRGIGISLKYKTYYWEAVPLPKNERGHSREWDGEFVRDKTGKWIATKPVETHVWGPEKTDD